MTDQLPDPLVPADVDLRGYEFMPFYGDRCFKSESWIAATPEARVAMIRIWWHAWAHEIPSASLPDNDPLLREYAGYGAGPGAWRRIRNQVLAGFVKCTDGRLYHKVLSTWAIEAWEGRKALRHRTEAARLARLSQRKSQNEKAPPKPSVTDSTGTDRGQGQGQNTTTTDNLPTGDKSPPRANGSAVVVGSSLKFPENLPRGQVDDIARALQGHSRAQDFVDELATSMQTKAIDNPVGFVVKLKAKDAEGKFSVSQKTRRMQAEREHATAQAELAKAGRSESGERDPIRAPWPFKADGSRIA